MATQFPRLIAAALFIDLRSKVQILQPPVCDVGVTDELNKALAKL